MANYKTARDNMIQGQLEPGGVTDPDLLEAFAKVPRDEFLPEDKKARSYVDEDVLLGKKGFLLEPLVLGRMMQVAKLRKNDIVLNIGDYTGYSSALLSDLVTTIVALKSDPEMFEQARLCWADADFCNIAVLDGEARKGCPQHEPYSLIILNGAVEEVPDGLKRQLSIGGRLVTVLKAPGSPSGAITVISRDSDESYSCHRYFDAAVPYLIDFTPEPAFAL